MDKRQEERLALEGNSVFTDLRMQRDALLEALVEMTEIMVEDGYDNTIVKKARAAIRAARGGDNG